MTCTSCHRDLPPGTTFCPYCGTRNAELAPSPYDPYTSGPAADEPVDAPSPPAVPPPVAPPVAPPAAPAAYPPAAPRPASAFDPMQFLFMAPVLRALGRGDVFKRVFAGALLLQAVATVLGGLVVWIKTWNVLDYIDGVAVLGVLVFQLLFVVVIYMLAHTYLIRARSALALGDTRYPMTMLASIAVRLTGETAAIWIAGVSVAASIAMLFAGDQGAFLLGQVPGLEGLASFGALAGVIGLLIAFCVLTFAYWLAETLRIGADIARNTRLTAAALDRDAVLDV